MVGFLSLLGSVLFAYVFLSSAWKELFYDLGQDVHIKLTDMVRVAVKVAGCLTFICGTTSGATILLGWCIITLVYTHDLRELALYLSYTGALLFFIGLKMDTRRLRGPKKSDKKEM